MQCCFGSAVQGCISCVTANNIAIGEGGNSLLICDSKHFRQESAKNRYFSNVSQQVLSEVVAFLVVVLSQIVLTKVPLPFSFISVSIVIQVACPIRLDYP